MPEKDSYSLPIDWMQRMRSLGYSSLDIARMNTSEVISILYNQKAAIPPLPAAYKVPTPRPIPSGTLVIRPAQFTQPEIETVPALVQEALDAQKIAATQGLTIKKLGASGKTESAAQTKEEWWPMVKSNYLKTGPKELQQQLEYADKLQKDLLRVEIANRKGEITAEQKRARQSNLIEKEADRRQKELLRSGIESRKAELNTQFFQEQVSPFSKVTQALSAVDPRFVDPTKSTFKVKPLRNDYQEVTASFRNEYDQIEKLSLVYDKQGNVVDTLGKKYKSFAGQLKQNYGEVLRWTIAVSLLYAPMQKLGELTTAMIQNQTRLAQVAVTLGTSQAATNRVFEAAARIAKETGTNVEGVIEGYNLAVRATGDAATATERYAQAEDLLKNSIVLSKLANIDQTTATDVLTASYKQLQDQGLKSSSELLDKWVTVSRNANVDVNTLATSFGLVAEAATNAGLSIDQLNGLIATVAEKTITSARETGNVVRALVSGYSTDQAVKALGRYGIAVTDAQGRTRDFLDVVADVKGQVNQGFIGKDQLNEIALAWGGGNRRQAQTVIGILGYERMLGIAETSAASPQGAAAKALETLLNTIEGSLTKLSVSFTELAQSLGTDGGLLEALKGIVDTSKVAVDGLTALSKALGGALPFLAGIGISGALFGSSSKLNLLTPLLSNLSTVGGGIKGAASTGMTYAGAYMGQFQEFLTSTQTGRALAGWGSKIGESFGSMARAYSPAIGLTIATGMLAVLTKGSSGDWLGAGEIIAGGVLGGLLGSAVGLAPLGVVIGTTIAEAFAAETERNKDRIAAALSSAGIPFQEQTPTTTPTMNLSTGQQIPEILLAATYGADYKSIVNQRPQLLLERETQKVGEFALQIQRDYQEFQNKYGGPNMGYSTALGLVAGVDISKPGNINYGGFSKQYGTYNPIDALLNAVAPDRQTMSPDEIKAIFVKAQEEALAATQTQYSKGVLGFGTTNRTVIEELQRHQIEQLKLQFNTGDISQRELATRRLDLSAGPNKAAALAYPLVQRGADLNETLNQVTEVIAKGTTDEINNLISYAAVIQKFNEDFEKAKQALGEVAITGATEIKIEDVIYTVDEFTKKIDDAGRDYADAWAEVFSEMINRTEIPSIVDFTSSGLDSKDIDLLVKRLPEYIKKQAAELGIINENYGKAFQVQQDRSKTILRSTEGELTEVEATPEIVRALFQNLKEANEIIKGMQIQQYKLTSEEFSNPQSQFNQIYSKLLQQSTALGYTPNLENFIIYTEDKKLLEAVQKDTRIVGLAIEETNNLLEKQLNGVFNLPSGASFYVPYQAARMSRETDEKIATRTFNTAVEKFSNAVDEFRRERIEENKNIIAGIKEKTTIPSYDEEFLALKDRKAEMALNGGYMEGYRGSYAQGTYQPDYVLPWKYNPYPILPGFGAGLSGGASFIPQSENEALNKTINAKLDLRIDNRVTLVANGRILAEVIKPYLEQDLVTFSNSTTSRVVSNSGYMVGI